MPIIVSKAFIRTLSENTSVYQLISVPVLLFLALLSAVLPDVKPLPLISVSGTPEIDLILVVPVPLWIAV